jgi:hypothetical protein
LLEWGLTKSTVAADALPHHAKVARSAAMATRLNRGTVWTSGIRGVEEALHSCLLRGINSIRYVLGMTQLTICLDRTISGVGRTSRNRTVANQP